MSTLDLKNALWCSYYAFRKIRENSCGSNSVTSYTNLMYYYRLALVLLTVPFVFMKIMKPVIKLLRSCGYLSAVYSNDILLIGNTLVLCLVNNKATKQLLTGVGFIVNKEKSNLVPRTRCKFLGYIIDTKQFQVALPADKLNKIKMELVWLENSF